MTDIALYYLLGILTGTVCGGCIGICSIVIKNYIDSKRHKTDIENITKNILHTTGDVEYMNARPIV
jgi:hypothetical protein